MKATAAMLLMSAAALFSQPQVQVDGPELVPGFLIGESLEINGVRLMRNAPRAEVAAALGSKMRVAMKPKRYTTSKLLNENRLAENLAPMMPAEIYRVADSLAEECGNECWQEMVTVELSKSDQIRIMLQGPTREQLTARTFILDRNRALMTRWRSQMIADLQERARYYIMEDGVTRIGQIGNTIRIERIQ